MKTFREVCEAKLKYLNYTRDSKRKYIALISEDSIDNIHSEVPCENWRQVCIEFWARAYFKEYAYCNTEYGIVSNFGCFDKSPDKIIADEVDIRVRELNICPDCLRHKPNLDGWCGQCGAGY